MIGDSGGQGGRGLENVTPDVVPGVNVRRGECGGAATPTCPRGGRLLYHACAIETNRERHGPGPGNH